jgi:RHS repeat-associated protein
MRLYMGRAEGGYSSGYLYMNAGVPSAEACTPDSLRFTLAPKEVEVIRDKGFRVLRQIMGPQGLADIVPEGDYVYTVTFYDSTCTFELSPTGHHYEVQSGNPSVRWTIGHTDVIDNVTSEPAEFNKLSILKDIDADGAVEQRWDYTYAPSGSDNVLTVNILDASSSFAQTATKLIEALPNNERRETLTVTTGQDAALKESRKYHNYVGTTIGEKLVEHVLDPDGVQLTTTWQYNTTPQTNGYGKVQVVRNSDGSWQAFEYDEYARPTCVYNSWKDNDVSYNANQARATHYSYSAVDPNDSPAADDPYPRTVWETVPNDTGDASVTVSKTFFAYVLTGEAPNPKLQKIEKRCPNADAVYSDTGNLTTTTTYADTLPVRVETIQYPDSRLDTFVVERGYYDPTGHTTPQTFTINAEGPAQRETVTHGLVGQAAGVAGKTTREETVTDARGNRVLEQTLVYAGGTTYEAIDWTVWVYDDHAHVTDTYRINGEQTHNAWDCCRLDSETDATGVTTTYTQRDGLGRVTEKKREALSGGGLPAQPELTTTYTYDAMGRPLTVTDSAGGVSEGRTTQYDLTGRTTDTTDASGLHTTYLHEYTTQGGRKETVTRPAGITEVMEYYRDGRVKTVGGTAVVAQTYEYGVNAEGTQWTKVYTGPAGTGSPMWTKSTADFLGRSIKSEHPGFGTSTPRPTVATVSDYYTASDTNPHKCIDKLKSTVTTVDNTPIVAPTLYEYDSLGNTFRSGLDLGGNGALDPASTDRISETETQYYKVGSNWWEITVSRVYAQANGTPTPPLPGEGQPPTLNISKRRLTGFASGVTQETASVGLYENNAVTVTTSIDGTNKLETQTTTYPDSTTAASITRAGLLLRSTSRSGLATNYTYDGIGRQIGVTDARSNTVTTTYDDNHADGWVDVVEDAANHKTASEYDTTSGRLIAVTSDATWNESTQQWEGKKQYFSYNDLGRQVRTWGHTTYPAEYVYDLYGHKTEMYTWQDRGSEYDWTSANWPAPAEHTGGDKTTWTYDTPTGLLTEKMDAANHVVAYGYYDDGKPHTRTWARKIGNNNDLVTTYAYWGDESGEPKTGELHSITYSDSTPSVMFTYDRLGRQSQIDDAVGTRTFVYNDTYLRLDREEINVSGGGLYSKIISPKHETTGTSKGRDVGFQIGVTGDLDQDYDVTYGYDTAGRLNSVTSPAGLGDGVTYTYKTNTDLVGTLDFKSGQNAVVRATRAYEDHRDLLSSIENTWVASPTPPISKYTYVNDALGRRTSVVTTGSVFGTGRLFKWGYNDRSELTTADRHEGTVLDPPGDRILPSDFDYTYDNIGNRKSYSLDPPSPSYYCTNSLNQYTAIAQDESCEYPGLWFEYDEDGNTVGDEDTGYDYEYTWDAENRLVEVHAIDWFEDCWNDMLVRFTYDYLGRRVRKQTFAYTRGLQYCELETEPMEDLRFVYDGWNVVMVLDGLNGNATLRKYTWGLDLSGLGGLGVSSSGIHGAGGIGGLLAVDDGASGYWYLYDANGNVGQILGTNPLGVAGAYEYDPYGNVILLDDSDSSGIVYDNRFRFSTKWFDCLATDDCTYPPGHGLYYYGYRYYAPRWGRWLNEDPTGEGAGPNLYGFAHNAPTMSVDPDGRWIISLGGASGYGDGAFFGTIKQLEQAEADFYERRLPCVVGKRKPTKNVIRDPTEAFPPLIPLIANWRAAVHRLEYAVDEYNQYLKEIQERQEKGECVCPEYLHIVGYSDGASTIAHYLNGIYRSQTCSNSSDPGGRTTSTCKLNGELPAGLVGVVGLIDVVRHAMDGKHTVGPDNVVGKPLAVWPGAVENVGFRSTKHGLLDWTGFQIVGFVAPEAWRDVPVDTNHGGMPGHPIVRSELLYELNNALQYLRHRDAADGSCKCAGFDY